MALPQTVKTDMIGNLALTISTESTVDFDAIVLDTETRVLRGLLGDKLFNDQEANPDKQKFKDLLDGVTWIDDDDDLTPHILTGMKIALHYFVYYDWGNFLPSVNTFVGKVLSDNENSIALTRQQNNIGIADRYSIAIDLYVEARAFIKRFEQNDKTYTTITESPAGTYTVLLANTLYLSNGDVVTIDKQEFTVAGLVLNTSFTFTAANGLTFVVNGDLFWKPFEDVANLELGKIDLEGLV